MCIYSRLSFFKASLCKQDKILKLCVFLRKLPLPVQSEAARGAALFSPLRRTDAYLRFVSWCLSLGQQRTQLGETQNYFAAPVGLHNQTDSHRALERKTLGAKYSLPF